MAGKSRRPNVAMSPCRRSNVATLGQPISKSTIGNVATPQRRDVSASYVFSSLKAKRGVDFEVSEIVRTRARKSEQQ